MHIVVIGIRGFPKIQGGIEKHCENLYPKLVKMGYNITVIGRTPYIGGKPYEWKGVKFFPVNCPKKKALEAFIHTFKAVIVAKKFKPDILHIHAIGPAFWIILAKFIRFKVIVTHHGPDYKRKKWGRFARFILKIGENWACRFADEIICVSKYFTENLSKKYLRRTFHYIPNGVDIPDRISSVEYMKKYGLIEGKYMLAVGRIVPEKGFDYLIDGFNSIKNHNWKLVIVGGVDHEDNYSINLKKKAKSSPCVISTGFIVGLPLFELYSNANFFVIPSYHEGLPIVMLEAASYGLPILASDISANKSVNLPLCRYFTCGNKEELKRMIREMMDTNFSNMKRITQINYVRKNYNWDIIAKETEKVYKSLI